MVTLRSADAEVVVDRRTGCVTSLKVAGVRMGKSGREPVGLLEVADLHGRRVYDPLNSNCAVSAWKETRTGGKKTLSFTQQYEAAPFRIVQRFRETSAGIRWEARLRLLGAEKENRSVRVTWVLPIPFGWTFWSPQDTSVHRNDGVTPRRYVYGHISFRPSGTMIPLVATWGPAPGRGRGRRGRSRPADEAGLAVFSPPDVQKPYISFDLNTQAAPAPVRGIDNGFEDVPHLRIAHHLVGLRPGKELRLAVCLAGCEPDWRCALGHYVKCHKKLFEPVRATRKVEGMYGITTPTRLDAGEMESMKAAGVTFAEVHGHFPEYSTFMTREALKDPQLTWRCKPHPGKRLSLADNRRWIRKLKAAGIAPFMYWYNCHALPKTVKRLWADEPMIDERGRVMIKWERGSEPAMHGTPDSPYGRHLMEQLDLLLRAYPAATGFFVDNYAIEMIDFAHDDGVTMVHDRPAYDLNRNHQLLGPPCFRKAHKAGKVIMVNKISTIESLEGADMVLAETRGVASLRKHALACVFRPLFPLGMELEDEPHAAERGLQHLILLGCFPDEHLYRQDPEATTVYRPLTDAMIGKRWVLDFDPLDVPDGLEGEVFRIDRGAPHAGSVVVALANLTRSYQDRQFTEGLSVTVRLPEAARYRKAAWLGVEHAVEGPVPCKLRRKGKAITVALPPVGAAGILRLSR